MAINQIRRLRMLRGNTASTSTFTGLDGELVVDTGLKTIRVQDGTTAGGTILATSDQVNDLQDQIDNLIVGNVSYDANIRLVGDITGNGTTGSGSNVTTTLSNTGVTAGTYGNSTAIPVVTVDSKGRITSINTAVPSSASIQSVIAGYLPTYTGNLSAGNITVGNIIPSANVTYNLGSPTRQWKEIWVSNSTIYLNGIPLGLDNRNNLLVNNQPVVTYVNGNLNVGGNAVSGGSNTGIVAFETATNEAGIYNSNGGGITISNFSYWTQEAETAWIQIPPGNSTDNLRIVQELGNVGIVASTQNWTFTTTGHLVPGTDILQDLGTPTNRFRHVYVGPGSVYIGNNVISETDTGKLVLPGLTKATGYYAEEIEDEDRWGTNPTITGTVTVIDATRYAILAGQTPSANYAPATYIAQKDGNRVDEITVDETGGGWTKTEADYARDNNMYATNVADAINNFNAGDWVQIPFRVNIKAEDAEYEDIFGGADLGDFSIDGSTLEADSMIIRTVDDDMTLESDSDLFINIRNNGNVTIADRDGETFKFEPTLGKITFPDGSEQITAYTGSGNGLTIITPEDFEVPGVTTLAFAGAGVSVDRINDVTTVTIPGGGGDNSYTPEEPEHWNEPTVNTVPAALDELAARITAIQNYEIDGGNAFTPAAAELIIDGNGA